MEYDFSDLSAGYIQEFVDSHEFLYDIMFKVYPLPFSNTKEFQYIIQHRNRSCPHMVVTFNSRHERLSIISLEDSVKCSLKVSDTDLINKIQNISLQEFNDRLVEFDLEFDNFIVSYKMDTYGKLDLRNIKDTDDRSKMFDIFIDLRYGVSKSTYIYKQII